MPLLDLSKGNGRLVLTASTAKKGTRLHQAHSLAMNLIYGVAGRNPPYGLSTPSPPSAANRRLRSTIRSTALATATKPNTEVTALDAP